MTEFRTIPLSDIGESPLNPRSHYDLEDLEELSASIAEVGILEPLLVRPRYATDEARPPGRFFPYEIVAGHRRKRAAHMAGLAEVPCLVRDLDDAQAIECALVENGQRADVTPMDEAGAFAELVRLGRSEAQIAAKIGRSVAYVSQRLRLLALAPEVLDLMERGRLLMGGALLLAQLPRERQEEIASRLTHGTGVLSRRDVSTWVARTSRKVGLAVWPLEGTAHGPSCAACPKRSGTQRSLLAELEGDDLCLDAVCWAAKGAAWLDEQRAAGRVIASPEESDEDRAAREARNAAADLERKVEEETCLLTIERIAEKADDSANARVMRGLVLGCIEAIGAWMLPEIAERRGVEADGDTLPGAAMRKEIARYDADQCASVLAEMLAIRFVRNAAPGEVHAAIAPLLSAIRVEPAKVLEEVAQRYAPKPAAPEKKKATKVRAKRESAEAT